MEEQISKNEGKAHMPSNDDIVAVDANNNGKISNANISEQTVDPHLQQPQPTNSFSMDSSNVSDDMDLIDMEEESFYSQGENNAGDDNIWGLLSGVAGNIYEWYV